MKYNCIVILSICSLSSIHAPQPNKFHRCINLIQRVWRSYQIGQKLNAEIKECLHDIMFIDLLAVKNKKDKNYPNCSDFRSFTFQFPPEGLDQAIIEVACTGNMRRNTAKVNAIVIHDKTVFGGNVSLFYHFNMDLYEIINSILNIVNINKFPPYPDFGLPSQKKYKTRPLNQKEILHNEKLAAVKVKFTEEMMIAMIYLDESDFQYAIFQTLDKECAWIGWRSGIKHSSEVPNEIKEFLKRNEIVDLDHEEASTSGT